MFCTKCGKELADNAKFCTGCGAQVGAAAPAVTPQAAEPVAPAEEAPAVPVSAPETPETPAPEATADAPVQPPVPPVSPAAELLTPKQKNQTLILALAVAAVAVVAAVVTFFAWIYPSYLSGAAKLEKATNQAELAMTDEDYDAAIAHYTDALALAEEGSETYIDLLVARAGAYLGAEDYDAAIDDYEDALALDADQKKVWLRLSDAYLAADDEEHARDALERGYDATGASSLRDALDELGEPVAPPSMEAPTPDDAPTASADGTIEIGGQTISLDETVISLSYCDLTDISALAQCTAVEWLDLSGNGISDISALAGLTKLESLWLDDNEIADLSPLSGLKNLTFLTLEENEFTDLSPLAGLTKLESLYLYDNDIRDLSPLAGLTSLESLTLWNTPVSDLTPLTNLKKLSYLDLDDTNVSDITPLLGMTQLETLYLSGDELPDDAWDRIAAALPQFSDMASDDTDDAGFYTDVLHIGSALYLSDDFIFEDDDGYLTGYAIDLACDIADELYWADLTDDYDFYAYDSAEEALDALYSGQVHMLILPVAAEELSAAGDLIFSDPFYAVSAAETYCVVFCDDMGALCEATSEAIADLDDIGRLDELFDAYFS